jgi:hypothetical protein
LRKLLRHPDHGAAHAGRDAVIAICLLHLRFASRAVVLREPVRGVANARPQFRSGAARLSLL